MNYRNTMFVDNNGILEIGGVKTTDLAKKYGTPLYVMDINYVEAVVKAYKETIDNTYGNGNIAYASKAMSCMAIYKIMSKLGACADLVSGGEIYTALKAGFDLKNGYFHGNNKLESELTLAMDNGIGTIVIDNLEEIDIVNKMAEDRNITQKVMLRINPGVEAHTHKFIQTATIDSKFGFSIKTNDATETVLKILECNNLYFAGFESHIGSQIFDKKAFALAVEVITDYCVEIKNKYDIKVDELNFGGGYGVYYTEEDPKFTVQEYCEYVKTITSTLNDCVNRKGLKKPYLMLEPGRSIVGEAGITLYTVGNIKDIKGVRKYIAIDGGMFDNIRPALYEAKYEAVLANRANDAAEEVVTIAGKCCESGDIIIKDIKLPKANRGDILAVFTTGAYNYSMASNYNRNFIPATVFVKDGKSALAVKPQTYDDIIRNDTDLEIE